MIVLPMAGNSRRFAEAGFKVPKYMLEAHGEPVFAHVLRSFARYFDTTPFLFIHRADHDATSFIENEVARLGIASAQLHRLERPTRGQADTIRLALEAANVDRAQPITIFNIDTIRPRFVLPEAATADGYLEVFTAPGDGWSFVEPVPGTDRVARTTEKLRISDLCSTGLYHFRRAGDFIDVAGEAAQSNDLAAGELYVAPLYNRLVAAGKDIRFNAVERTEVILCGVPQEYQDFVAGPPPRY